MHSPQRTHCLKTARNQLSQDYRSLHDLPGAGFNRRSLLQQALISRLQQQILTNCTHLHIPSVMPSHHITQRQLGHPVTGS
jgi:hypothetical protein